MEKEDKVSRVLQLYDKFRKGFLVNKAETAEELKVNERTIQRDIEGLRTYLEDFFQGQEIIYNRQRQGYYLIGGKSNGISAKELLVITKILLESRALNEQEMKQIMQSLLDQSDKDEAKLIHTIVGNELLHYVPLQHNKTLMQPVWELASIIKNKQMVEITYERMDHQETVRKLKPVSILFSEYYFYLVAFIDGLEHLSPAIFRIDRIKHIKQLPKKFKFAEKDRLEEGILRKRIQFMYSGELLRVKFKFRGVTITPALDRFPNAKVLETLADGWLIEAEVYGKGCVMWLLSQGSKVEVMSPATLREEIKETIQNMAELYKE